MSHPVFLNSKAAAAFFGSWILLAGIHFSIFYLAYSFPVEIAGADSLVFNFIFCGISIPLWYVVRYSVPDRNNRVNVLITHITSATLVLLIWYGLSYTVLNLIFSSIKPYTQFLVNSIPYRIVSGFLLYALLCMGYYLYIYYRNLQEKLLVEARLREMLKESELNMLKSQINPHFLFNSLNSISSLTITNPDKAREMVIKLSDFLRYTVSTNTSSFTSFEKELSNIQRYLDIEKVRFGDKLVYDLKTDGSCKDAQIPFMLLQPLFENAIKHGVYESTEQVSIEMKCSMKDCCLEIELLNNFDPAAPARKGSGLGLKNIRERLRLLYKSDSLLKTHVEGNRFRVELSIPVKN